MSGKLYLKNQLPVILINVSGMAALAVFLLINKNSADSIIFIIFVWTSVMFGCFAVNYFLRKKQLNKLMMLAEELEEKYLIAELMKEPERADDKVFYQILKMAERSMLEKIEVVHRERKEYREYIEQWVHEIKTPITAMKLLCENNRSGLTRDLLAELEKTNRFTEQTLYYARSEHTEKDYSIREIRLSDIIHEAIADNKYLLRQNKVTVEVKETEDTAYTDDKWVCFILNQLIGNAVKYRTERPVLYFGTEKQGNRVCLFVEDNGIGISEHDLPRIFEKGFTGQNGRTIQNATGIGLYLCKRLCDKLGIGLEVRSGSGGSTFVLSFHINYFVIHVQD